MSLVLVPHDAPILRQRVPEFDGNPADLREIARQMYHCMVYPRNGVIGVGLAANQVGLDHRMFVMLSTPRPAGFGLARVCINPTIEEQSDEREMSESCLSFAGESVRTRRAYRIVGAWTDLRGRRQRAEMFGLSAQCFAHELDHLDGLTMHDRGGAMTEPMSGCTVDRGDTLTLAHIERLKQHIEKHAAPVPRLLLIPRWLAVECEREGIIPPGWRDWDTFDRDLPGVGPVRIVVAERLFVNIAAHNIGGEL